MQQLVSVIIPCYNSTLTIQRAIQCVLGQTHLHFELIIVDDASADFEVLSEIIINLNDDRIKIVRHEINKNGSAARNTGISIAKGHFIAFLDSDDEWFPAHLENSLNHFSRLNSDNYIIYCQNLVKSGSRPDIVMPSTGINEHEKISEYLFCNNGYMSTPSFFAKASVFVNNLFDESLIRHQDYELLLRLESCGYQFSFSDHLGVIVHWEDNDTEKKGGTWKYSLDFSKKYKTYFTSKAFTYFILKNVIYPLFIKKQKWLGLKLFIRNCSLLKIGLKDWLFFIDYLFFGKLTIINLFLKLKT